MSSGFVVEDSNDGLLRFIHPMNSNLDGTLNSGAFSLRRDPAVSLAFHRCVPPDRFEAFCALKPTQGVARITTADAEALELTVTPEEEPEWGEFAHAHAVLGGYIQWPNNKKDSVARRLRDIANRDILKVASRSPLS